jgi:homospermidine synthase
VSRSPSAIDARRRILLVGCGSIGQALLPLLFRHFPWPADRMHILAADEAGRPAAQHWGIAYENRPLTPDNYRQSLARHLGPGDLLINVSVDVSSLALIDWCQENGVLYLDTCIEPWAGGYGAADAHCSNYALRQAALARQRPGAPTAVIAHGANPGLISHLAKVALTSLAALRGITCATSRWAELACQLGIQVVQIAERDTQQGNLTLAPGSFANTWSVPGLLAEAWQCAELGWGSHETELPENGHRHREGDHSGIYLDAHSASLRVKSWLPSRGQAPAYLITHHEALSLAALLTLPGERPEHPVYRPTVYYAYQPCPAAARGLAEWQARGYTPPRETIILRDHLHSGQDELGVLLVFAGGAYWYGSTLTLAEARSLAPFNSATTLQVAAGIIGALDWMLSHPQAGVVEAESLDHARVLALANPYLGTVGGVLSDWQPNPREPGRLDFQQFRLSPCMREFALETI